MCYFFRIMRVRTARTTTSRYTTWISVLGLNSFAFICAPSHSAATSSLAFCEVSFLDKERASSTGVHTDDIRMHEMNRIYGEIGALQQEMRTNREVPAGFFKNCLARKHESFNNHLRLCTNSAAAKFDFHMIVARYFELQGRTKDALDHFARASEIDPKDYTAPYKAYAKFMELKNAQFDIAEKTPGSITDREINEVFTKGNAWLAKIADNPKAPPELKTEVYEIRARGLEAVGRKAEAMSDWKHMLEVDPNNVGALRKVAQFELARGRRAEARKYLEKLAPLAAGNAALQKELIEVQLEAEDFAAALKTAERASSKLEDVELKAYKARALAGLERLDEATPLSKSLMKTYSKNKAVRQTQAFIHVQYGEKWMKEDMPGKALAEFNSALNLDPDNKKLRKRMATLIFEQREAAGMKPGEATRKDLDQTVKLLRPLLNDTFVEQRTVEVFIHASAHSSEAKAGVPGCSRYKDDFGSFPVIALVLECASIYREAGDKESARKILEEALEDSRFKGTTSQIASALAEVK